MKIVIMVLIAPVTLLLAIIQLAVLCLALVFVLFKNAEANEYLKRNFVAVDQTVNTLFFGDEDETISSRMGKHLAKRDCPFCNLMCRFLNLFQADHCVKSIEKDEGTPM